MSTVVGLQIERWAAWAPGLESRQAWQEWLRDPAAVELPAQNVTPPLAEMPAMMRRRVEPLGRVALQAAYWAQGSDEMRSTGPVVFASRWGEMARSVELLQQLAAGEPLSPTAFSLSVHNAIGALYSIARKDRHNYQAVSAGEHSLEAGFIEAAGLLADGAERVLLVFFDGPLPELYAAFELPGTERFPYAFPYAFACLLSRSDAGIGLRSRAAEADDARAMPSNFDLMRFLLLDPAPGAALQRPGPAHCWVWTRP